MIILSEILNFCPTLHSLARWRYLRREHQTYRGWWWAFIWCYLLRFSGKTFYYTSAILPIWKEPGACLSVWWFVSKAQTYMCRNETLLSQHLIKISLLGSAISTLDTSFHLLSVSQWKKEVDENMEHEKLYQVSDGFARDTWMIGGIRFCSHKYFGSLAAT